MLSAYLLFPHYAQCLPIILALCSMLSDTYYSQNYASIIRPTLVVKQSVHVRQCVSQCVTVSHQHFGLITTTKILNTSLHHSNSGNSDKT